VSFHQQSFAARHGAMGDESEAVFDSLHGERVHRLGLNRYWANGGKLHLNQMTTPMRYAPDRQTIDRYVECMGVGRDQTLKIKDEKLVSLLRWNNLGPVDLFVYDSKHNRWWQAHILEWNQAITDHATVDHFPEGKAYWALHATHFPGEPCDVETGDGT
jgi:hypothetical protein